MKKALVYVGVFAAALSTSIFSTSSPTGGAPASAGSIALLEKQLADLNGKVTTLEGAVEDMSSQLTKERGRGEIVDPYTVIPASTPHFPTEAPPEFKLAREAASAKAALLTSKEKPGSKAAKEKTKTEADKPKEPFELIGFRNDGGIDRLVYRAVDGFVHVASPGEGLLGAEAKYIGIKNGQARIQVGKKEKLVAVN